MMKMNKRRQKQFKDEGLCSLQFLKYSVCVFNTLFLISGAAVLAVGVWTLIESHTYVSLLSTITYQVATYVLMGTGGLALIVGIIGCIGALKENRAALMMYACFLLLIFLLEAAAGILCYMYESVIKEGLKQNLGLSMIKSYRYDIDKTAAIDGLQQEFQCCGANNYSEWKKSNWLVNMKKTNNTVPDSCCRTYMTNCGVSSHPSNIYHDGCIDGLHGYLKKHLIIIGAVGLGVCLLQIFGIVLSCCLSSKIKQWNNLRLQSNHATEYY